jgi:hypothetical protein
MMSEIFAAPLSKPKITLFVGIEIYATPFLAS